MFKMPFHQQSCLKRVSGSNCLIDFSVDRGRLSKVVQRLCLLQSIAGEVGGNGLKHRIENCIAGGARNDAMETHVVRSVFLTIIEGRKHLDNLFSQVPQLDLCESKDGQFNESCFDPKSSLKEL